MSPVGKAMARRLRDADFHTRYLVGNGLDVCAVGDSLVPYRDLLPQVKTIRTWNGTDGDTQHLTGLADSSYDFVHAAFTLQRQPEPAEAMRHWFRVLKPDGHLILLVPDEDMYEQGCWPSRLDPLNRWTITLAKARSWSPVSRNLLDLVGGLGIQADIRRMEVLDAGYRHGLGRIDRTRTDMAECAIEMVLRKRSAAEAVAGGRLNPVPPPSP